jgi:DNA-binding NtrC family response regulator
MTANLLMGRCIVYFIFFKKACMEKLHILLVENCENEIEFFITALKESGISFMCSTARNTEQAVKILRNSVPDAIFMRANMCPEKISEIKKLRRIQGTTLILYSTAQAAGANSVNIKHNYVQLPSSIEVMAHILKNLFTNHLVSA